MRKPLVVALTMCMLSLAVLVPAVHAQTLVTSISLGNIGAMGPPVFDAANGNIYVSATGTENDGSVSIISGSANTVTQTLYFGGTLEAGLGTLDTANGDVYVADLGHTIHVISGTTNAVIQNITVGDGPAGAPAYDPSNGMMYVSNIAGSSVSVIDTSNNSVIATLPVSSGASDPLFDPVSGDVYIPGFNATTVISASTNKIVDAIPFVNGVGSLGLDSATGSVLASGGGRLVTISSSNQVVANVTAEGDSPVFDPSNSDFYLTALSSSVVVYSATSNSVVGNVSLSGNPIGIAVDGANGDVLVTYSSGSPATGFAAVISGTTVLGEVQVGQGPATPVFDSSNGFFYVPNNDGTVSVVNPQTGSAPSSTTSAATTATTTSSSTALSYSYLFLVIATFASVAVAYAGSLLRNRRGFIRDHPVA
jgi:YVTN family beta-propeller protein